MYSMNRAEFAAISSPRIRAIRLRAISIPAETPEDVMMSPSSTQRA